MDAIANHLWQSTIFGAAAALLALLFRNNSASVRYWIWFAAAMKFLIPFAALTAIAGLIPLPQVPPATGALVAATVIFRSSTVPSMPGIASTFVIIVWLLGAFVVLAKWACQWQRLATDARQSPPIRDGVVHDTLRRVERAEGIRKPITIVASSESIEPGVIGAWAPVLIWPQHLTPGLNDAQIETVIAHEVCHIVRRDNLLASTQILVTAVFWFHPLVWWIGARLVDERERACDEHVLASGRSRATYAESILETCRLCLASPVVNVSGVTGGNLKTRIVRIMKNAPTPPLGLGKKTTLVLAALLMGFAPIAAGISTAVPRLSSEAAAARQDADREVHRPGGRVVAPKLVREVKPQYTPRAMEEKIQGEVLMECVVKADGTVGDKKIVKSLDPDLDQAALDAAAQWLFEPGTRDGKPVNVLVTIAIAFTLK
jgi:bla regulator protein BlaR1